jgi:hypothetical protein
MLAANVLLFGRLLRRAGLDVHGGRMIDAVEALSLVGVGRRVDVRHVLRTLLIHRHEDLPLFDRAFDLFWRRRGEQWGRSDLRSINEGRSRLDVRVLVPAAGGEGPRQDGRAADEDDVPVLERQTWSAREALRQKSFSTYTDAEVQEAAAAMASLRWDPGSRRTRRWVRGGGTTIDLRRALRRTVRTGGELVWPPYRERRLRVRPIVVIADVSGSMERYTRMVLHFVHTLVRRRRRVDAFLFSTRLTRITREMRRSNPDAAVGAAARTVHDWAGGTRIGDALREFNLRWARRVLTGGAVVLLISDGWDRGDPERLARETAHLQRSCHRLAWLNPLLGTPGYEPLTRGMQAARPHVDDFLPVHNLASLEQLAAHLNTLPRHRAARRQHQSSIVNRQSSMA